MLILNRNVCYAIWSINGDLSDWVSALVDPMNMETGKYEVTSIEEMAACFDNVVKEHTNEDSDNSDLIVFHLDPVGPYPVRRSSERASQGQNVSFENQKKGCCQKKMPLVWT